MQFNAQYGAAVDRDPATGYITVRCGGAPGFLGHFVSDGHPIQAPVLAMPAADFRMKVGRFQPHQLTSRMPHVINAFLIQSRGVLWNTGHASHACAECLRRRTGCDPFPECRYVPGHFGGSCGNCKWRSHSNRCHTGLPGNPPVRRSAVPVAPVPAVSVRRAGRRRRMTTVVIDDTDSDGSLYEAPNGMSGSQVARRTRGAQAAGRAVVRAAAAPGSSEDPLVID